MPDSVLDKMITAPVVPTVFPLDADVLRLYARALHAEGFPALEVLARPLDAAMAAMEKINNSPERNLILWGLGTIITEAAARQAVALRPDFLVSPAFSRRVLRVATEAGIPYIPGVFTFQDVQDVIETFAEYGLPIKALKLCPVQQATPDYLRMLATCYPEIVFFPSGNIPLEDIASWTQFSYVSAPMDSKFVPREMLERLDIEEVRGRLRTIRLYADGVSLVETESSLAVPPRAEAFNR